MRSATRKIETLGAISFDRVEHGAGKALEVSAELAEHFVRLGAAKLADADAIAEPTGEPEGAGVPADAGKGKTKGKGKTAKPAGAPVE